MGREISLRASDILRYKHMERQLERCSIERFKRLSEGGCIPVHLARGGEAVLIEPYRKNPRLELPDHLGLRALEISLKENKKLRDAGIDGDWIDGKKLAVHSADKYQDRIRLRVSMIRWSEIEALRGLSLEDMLRLKVLKLDTYTHLVCKEDGHELLVVGLQGKPPDPRMGKQNGRPRWTLSANGTVDAEILCTAGSPARVWVENSRNELREELGIDPEADLQYLGLILDAKVSIGALGIVGMMRTGLTLRQVEDARKQAIDQVEVEAIDAIAVEQEAFIRYLEANREGMTPQLITSLVMLGYSLWGESFLAGAER